MSPVLSKASSAWRKFRSYADLRDLASRIKYEKIRARFFADMWQTAACNIGATARPTPYGFIEIARGDLSTFVSRSQVMLDSQITLRVAGEKGLTYELLERLGAPMPRYRRVSIDDLAPAHAFLEQYAPVVVKPAGGTGGGRGVTTGVTTPEALRTAARRAARHAGWLMIEEQVQGENYRLLYLGGQFIDAVRRDPPSVVGDGSSSLRQLIAKANKARETAAPALALSPLAIDDDCRNWLSEQGLTLSSRPTAGERVTVKRAINQNDCRGNVNVSRLMHPDIIASCGRIAAAMGIELAGVDLMAPAIDQPFRDAGCRINEVNTTPGLHHHYLISNPADGVPVAEAILEYMFAKPSGAMRFGSLGRVAEPQ